MSDKNLTPFEQGAKRLGMVDESYKGINEGDAALKYPENEPNLKVIENPKNEFSNKLNEITHDFQKISYTMEKIVSMYVKEGDDWENVFDDLTDRLASIYSNVGYLNNMIDKKNIEIPLVETSLDIANSSMTIINGSIKKLNHGKIPDWFLKLNVADGDNWNFKIQVTYWMSIQAIRTFLELIVKIRKECNLAKPSFVIDDLMQGLPKEVEDSIRNSHFAKEIFKLAAEKAKELQI